MIRSALVVPVIVGLLLNVAVARRWQDATGTYAIEGDLIARSSDQVILKKANGRIIAVTIAELSQADQTYLKSKESEEALKVSANQYQTWTFRSGLKASGRLVDYVRRDLVVSRNRSKVYVNERPLASLPELYQAIVQKMVSHFGDVAVENNRDIEKWLESKEFKPQSFTLDGVMLKLENGDEYAVPFFLFADRDHEMLKPGWERWVQALDDKKEYEQKKAKEQFLLEAQARTYQQQQAQFQQIAHVQLSLLAAAAGAVDLWEVALYPARGAYGYPLTVVVGAQDSSSASAIAMQRYPGYVAGEVARRFLQSLSEKLSHLPAIKSPVAAEATRPGPPNEMPSISKHSWIGIAERWHWIGIAERWHWIGIAERWHWIARGANPWKLRA